MKKWQGHWSASELKLLRARYGKIGAIGIHKLLPHRKQGSIRQQAYLLGLKAPVPRKVNAWTRSELAILRRYYPRVGPAKVCRRLPGRSKLTIIKRASQLALRFRPERAMRERSRQRSDRRARWRDAEDAAVRRHYPLGGTRRVLPYVPGRSIFAIRQRAEDLGIKSLGRNGRG